MASQLTEQTCFFPYSLNMSKRKHSPLAPRLENRHHSGMKPARLTKRSRRFRHLTLISAWGLCSFVLFNQPLSQAVPKTHSHNDYEHDRPLLDALDHGFISVEADVFLIDGKLLVAHNRPDVDAEKTLERLYLEPLAERARSNNGHIYSNYDKPVLLLIDIKSKALPTYQAIHETLATYQDVFTQFDDMGNTHPKAVTAVISGNRPRDYMSGQKKRWAGYDGRPVDLREPFSASFIPLVSDSWSNHIKWRGKGTIASADLVKIRSLISESHRRGALFRFWASPDTAPVWNLLYNEGADLINTDDLSGLKTFLANKAKPE